MEGMKQVVISEGRRWCSNAEGRACTKFHLASDSEWILGTAQLVPPSLTIFKWCRWDS